MPRTLVFTATFNEAGNIRAWVDGVSEAVPDADLLVIDDGSPDGTGKILDDLATVNPKLRVIHRPGKAGLSSAHLRAVEEARTGGYELLVTMDADGSHQPHQIPALLEAARNADFVIGTRYRGGSHRAAPLRRILSLGANRLTMVILPTGLSEYTTSFRVFDREAMDVVSSSEFNAGGYAFFLECVEMMYRSGLRMVEVPIDFVDRAHGQSKIPKSQIALSMGALVSLGANRWFGRKPPLDGRRR